MKEPRIHVGIMAKRSIEAVLSGSFLCNGKTVEGEQRFDRSSQGILWNGIEYDSLLLTPADETTASFMLKGVTIGIGFHWQREEEQRFMGSLQLIGEGENIRVINHVKAEEYLRSVISSEMSATSSVELLKAHAVISRSWLLAQIAKRNRIDAACTPYCPDMETADEIIRWYDREDHRDYDVCADDHCQRYQGITRASTAAVDEAIDGTYGEVLCYDGKIADARFSKCCGGATECFESCWEPVHHPYLTTVRDNKTGYLPDLRCESQARKWILSAPDSFCNTDNPAVLLQILNGYDRETTRFYRWTVRYGQQELSELVRRRSGIDFGTITDLQPVERGKSGRIVRLRIAGTRRSLIVGKELEIRRWLSESHLYSSAFIVERESTANGENCFILHGAGWGHGVGLCQIGAAVMGAEGYNYDKILSHYFHGAKLTQLYQQENNR